MITFISLILGLTIGTHPIALTVAQPVSQVELVLDGTPVGRLERPPWVARVDFGTALRPHELVARGLDSNGVEVSRVSQLVNLPRSPAETQIVIVDDAQGNPVAARLFWASLTGVRPTKVNVTLDGVPIAVNDARVSLPPFDSTIAHVLTADVQFSSTLRSRSDIVIGGGAAGRAATELTAVAVEWSGGVPADRKALDNAFLANGEPAGVAAEEAGPAELLIVRDTGAGEILQKLAGGRRSTAAGAEGVAGLMGLPAAARPEDGDARDEGRLGGDDRAQFIWPLSQRYRGGAIASDLFARSHEFDFHLGLYTLLTRVEHPRGTARKQRLTDAVAVAGVDAMGSSRRRAVLLVLGSDVEDVSLFASPDVRRYLQMLHVPLFVWALDAKSRTAAAVRWGDVEDVSTSKGFETAFAGLRRVLASQRIVWLEGRFLPQAISLSPTARDVRLAP